MGRFALNSTLRYSYSIHYPTAGDTVDAREHTHGVWTREAHAWSGERSTRMVWGEKHTHGLGREAHAWSGDAREAHWYSVSGQEKHTHGVWTREKRIACRKRVMQSLPSSPRGHYCRVLRESISRVHRQHHRLSHPRLLEVTLPRGRRRRRLPDRCRFTTTPGHVDRVRNTLMPACFENRCGWRQSRMWVWVEARPQNRLDSRSSPAQTRGSRVCSPPSPSANARRRDGRGRPQSRQENLWSYFRERSRATSDTSPDPDAVPLLQMQYLSSRCSPLLQMQYLSSRCSTSPIQMQCLSALPIQIQYVPVRTPEWGRGDIVGVLTTEKMEASARPGSRFPRAWVFHVGVVRA